MALQGRHLKVAANTWIPWVDIKKEEDGSISATGVSAAFFDVFAQKLNFTYTLIMPEDGEWGRALPNGSFTGMVGMCQRKEVDLALGPFAVTFDRFPVVDFSITYFIDYFGIFLPRPRLERTLSSIIRPFAWQVWVILAGIIVISMGIGLLMEYLMSRRLNVVHPSRVHNVERTFQPIWVIRALLNEPSGVLPTTHTGRVFLGTWLLASLILSSAYCGVLTSLLAVPIVTIPVDTLEDLLSYGKIPWAMEKGTSLHSLFENAQSGIFKEIYDEVFLTTDIYNFRHRIVNERMAALADFLFMRKIIDDDFSVSGECKYYMGKEQFEQMNLAFAFPKGSNLTQHFNKWLAPLVESGLVSHSVLDLTKNSSACLVAPGKEGVNVPLVFSMVDLAGIFLFLGAGLLLGAISLMFERIFGES